MAGPCKRFGDRVPDAGLGTGAADDDQFDFKIVYKGNPRGNKIEGSNEFDFGDNTGTMKFTGKRVPPEEKKKDRPAEAKSAEATPAAEAKPADEAEPAKPAATDSEAAK